MNNYSELTATEVPPIVDLGILEILLHPGVFFGILIFTNIVSGAITMIIAHDNERDRTLAFMAGFFMGVFGIMTYAIMGETIELRVAIEEKERRKLAKTPSK